MLTPVALYIFICCVYYSCVCFCIFIFELFDGVVCSVFLNCPTVFNFNLCIVNKCPFSFSQSVLSVLWTHSVCNVWEGDYWKERSPPFNIMHDTDNLKYVQGKLQGFIWKWWHATISRLITWIDDYWSTRKILSRGQPHYKWRNKILKSCFNSVGEDFWKWDL